MPNVYERLGVRRVINAYECLTSLGGSVMPPEVVSAMSEASCWFIDLDDLQAKVGQRIADLVGVDAAFVTSGPAAGLCIATAACIAGTDPAAIVQLPDTSGLGNEVVIERAHRNRYDLALRQAGAKLVEFGYARGTELWELERAITMRTVVVAYFVTNATPSTLPLALVAEVAHRHGLPVIVDAAAELPPAGNLRRFVDEGGDLVVFSGGKGLRGPQSSGLILGRRDLIAACAANASPHTSIGRPMKVGKEEMIGILTAVELYMAEPDEDRLRRWEQQVQFVLEALAELPHAVVERTFPMPTGKLVPRALVQVSEGCLYGAQQIITQLREGEPSVAVRPAPLGFYVDPQNLQPGDVEIVCRRIHEIIKE